MTALSRLHIVIDTNVVFEGLTNQDSASALIIDAWIAGLLNVVVCDALAYEYIDVLSRKLSAKRWHNIEPVVEKLLAHARFVTRHFSWRPSSPDPGDEHVIDCAMNAAAAVVTLNRSDFRTAEENLGLRVLSPSDIVRLLALEIDTS